MDCSTAVCSVKIHTSPIPTLIVANCARKFALLVLPPIIAQLALVILQSLEIFVFAMSQMILFSTSMKILKYVFHAFLCLIIA